MTTKKWYEVMLKTFEKGVATHIDADGDTSWDAYAFETREEAEAVAKKVAGEIYAVDAVEVQEWTEGGDYEVVATYEGERTLTYAVFSEDDTGCEAKEQFCGSWDDCLAFYDAHKEDATFWSERADRSTFRTLTYSYQHWWIEDDNGEIMESSCCVRIYEGKPFDNGDYWTAEELKVAQQDWEDEVEEIKNYIPADYVVANR